MRPKRSRRLVEIWVVNRNRGVVAVRRSAACPSTFGIHEFHNKRARLWSVIGWTHKARDDHNDHDERNSSQLLKHTHNRTSTHIHTISKKHAKFAHMRTHTHLCTQTQYTHAYKRTQLHNRSTRSRLRVALRTEHTPRRQNSLIQHKTRTRHTGRQVCEATRSR